MRYIYLIFILFICIFINSCDDWSKGKFEITNNTPHIVDSVYIVPDKFLGNHYISLMPNETKYYETDMSGPGTDGAYGIKYKCKSVSKSMTFGYYSNGVSLEKLTKIYIQPDTIIFKFIN
jgi:hypothetical protein